MNNNKQGRDEKGRFIADIREDAENVAGIFYSIYRLLPGIFIMFVLWKYYDLSKFFYNITDTLTCGNGCRCDCTPIGKSSKDDF